MKLWIQLPSQRGKEKIQFRPYLDVVNRVKRPETEVSFQPVPPGPGVSSLGAFGYYGIRFLNDREILRNVSRAQGEGYDGAIIACYFDPALRAARQMLSIPVVGIAEASMLLASLMGLRFAVVTSDHRYVEDMEDTIQLYGMASRAISLRPVRAINMDEELFLSCLGGGFGPLVEDFAHVAEGCIQDGANVVIAGCGLLSPALVQAGVSHIGKAPVIDPVIAAIKIVEMMVDMNHASFPIVSRTGIFSLVPGEMLEGAGASGLL